MTNGQIVNPPYTDTPETVAGGGSAETKRYYDREGWTLQPDGRTTDLARWGVREDGPLRVAGYELRMQRVHDALAQAGSAQNLLECGGGGEPELSLLDLCRHYTGVDFSCPGLRIAATKLADRGVPFRLFAADMCSLPFADESFDASYSSHAVYHIPDATHQARALREICRVTRKGGVVVLILANPHPLMFPGRLARRLVADTPGLAYLANMLRPAPPIPFNPRPLGWMRKQLRPFGQVDIVGYSMASVWVYQNVSEHHGLGKAAWRAMVGLERDYPHLTARLGNYVMITVRR